MFYFFGTFSNAHRSALILILVKVLVVLPPSVWLRGVGGFKGLEPGEPSVGLDIKREIQIWAVNHSDRVNADI